MGMSVARATVLPMGENGLLGEAPVAALCHLCGVSTTMTRAHVPPQCAGNRNPVTRSRVMIRDRTLGPGRPSEGGIWLRTLCAGCNGLASRYDGAYGDFATRMRQHLPRPLDFTSRAGAVPSVQVAPGRVARSVLLGAVAVAPVIRRAHPTLTRDLLADAPEIRLPEGLELRVARTTGPFCRVASSYHMHRMSGLVGAYMEHLILAEIHFAPLSWILTHERSGTARLVW